MFAEERNSVNNLKELDVARLRAVRDCFAARDDVAAVYLFGSFGTEFQGKYSDIDLGVVYRPGEQPDLRRELQLEAELSLLLGTDYIDLVNLNRAPLQLRFKAISQGKILYEVYPDELSDFLEETYRLYGDYQVDLKVYYKEYRRALREAYVND